VALASPGEAPEPTGLDATPAALLGDEPVDAAPPIPEFEDARRSAARNLEDEVERATGELDAHPDEEE
jgi:hypothetical protein